MKIAFLLMALLGYTTATAQTIVGKWQLINESTCIDDELGASSAEEEELMNEMRTMAGPTPQTIEFKENNSAVESTRIVSRKKSYSSGAMLYKFTGEALHFLDKKSRTIIDSFIVERLSADSLIISNSQRACETRIFVKIK